MEFEDVNTIHYTDIMLTSQCKVAMQMLLVRTILMEVKCIKSLSKSIVCAPPRAVALGRCTARMTTTFGVCVCRVHPSQSCGPWQMYSKDDYYM